MVRDFFLIDNRKLFSSRLDPKLLSPVKENNRKFVVSKSEG